MFFFTRPNSVSATIRWTVFTCAIVGVALFHSRSWIHSSSQKPDFDSYYCGAKVILEGRDPYRVEPLRTCEANLGRLSPASPREINAFSVMPTPLPGYVLAFYEPLAELPYFTARLLFGISCLFAGIITAFCLSRLSPVPFLPSICIVFFAVTFVPIGGFGSMAPIAICFITIAATLARNGRLGLAVVALGVAMIQPQITTFSMIAAFLFFPKQRLVVGLVAIALFAISLATLGIQGNIEYLSLLPVHTAAETNSAPAQHSLAALLALLGIKPSLALTLGTAWSIAMFVGAMIVLSKVNSVATTVSTRDASVVIVPTAFAAFGGTFIHDTQMAVAILPAFFFVRPQGRLWLFPALALGALVVPIGWLGLTHGALPRFVLFSMALACAWLAVYYLSDVQRARSHANIVASIFAVGLCIAVLARPAEHTVDIAGLGIQGSQLSSTAWAMYQSALTAANHSAQHKFYAFFVCLPLWFSLLVIMTYVSMVTLRHQDNAQTDAGTPVAHPTYA